ncbi:serine/threonine-protein kinase [Phytohabitans sp. ZYX-F-186]|uniref:non-specific serine/threonine protein kinase n=1 Tax=Phytohabitans maris TaxID=3071409 RepID=A0ABU0ZKX3_9ACTN|nr:serine/threonine-protein kinase [Phytohabitans sp. ZYX-F-186]MDQ7906905.1 serine/threonine-protein kinase [Phytohabitans sp. ZYX-F-186]
MTDGPPSALPLPVVPGLSGLSVLARGGYATVYRAIQESVAREVAVKVENRTLDNERDQRRFLREARAAGRMSSHPHVVDLFDAGVTADQHPYLIMELCEGSYADRMRDAPLVPAEAREVGMKIADALSDAHHLGVLHRDVKPANILRSRFGEPALADFGLAVLAEARDSSVTLEVLTPAYAPPEMFRHSAPSPAVDVYALCATLYAVMRGKPPRWREDRNPSLITLMELFSQPIPDLPGVPAAMMEVLRHGMANEPESRPSAEQLRDMLAGVSLTEPPPSSAPRGVYVSRSYAPPTPTPSHPVSPGVSPSGPSAGPPPPPPTYPRAPGFVPAHDSTPTVGGRRRRSLHWILGGVAALALLAVVSASAWYVSGRPDPRPSPTALPTTGSPLPSLAGGALPGCLLPIAGGRCPDELECYGAADASGPGIRAQRVDCAGRHTWEAYAVGDLPAGADPDGVAGDPAVKSLCTDSTFMRTTLLLSTQGWQFEVLRPDGEGDRTFRCLAGKGRDALQGPTLAR